MMSQNNQQSVGDLQEAVEPVLRVLSQLGGHFTFPDKQGEQFVIARKTDFDANRGTQKPAERQLPFTGRMPMRNSPDTAGEVLDKINKEIALYQMNQQEEVDDLAADDVVDELYFQPGQPLPPPVRVRFEPIKGDLPPELQE